MNNKRNLVISAVAVLAVIITVAAGRVFPRSAQNAGLIPVTGLSSSGVSLVHENGQQNIAAYNSIVANTGESPEEEYVLSQQYHVTANSSFTNTGESPEEEYVLSQQYHATANSSVTNTGESPEEEYILSQQYHTADNSRVLGFPTSISAPAASQQALQMTGQYCPFTVQEILSLHMVTIGDDNEPMLETSEGPIGYDGGTFALSQCRISK
jgi:hypothetical protein